ncbi:MAG TPA: mechanosensitive ion channel family protein [Stellaceae bacterium]|jgi:small-conductance mechanosensitive channel|nr:mechanosensitive ion channel family protein [Stellaceae bacterium]
MIDLPAAGAAAARDPLVVTLFIFSLGGLLTHVLFRRHPLGRAMVRVFFLVVLSIVLLRAGVVPYEPLTPTGAPFQDAVHAALKIAWWLWAAWFVVGFLRVFVVTEHRPREGKLVQDLLAGLVYLAALFAIVAYVFDLPIKGLLATSGAIAIILGLALQSTLSDVFSGIVLNFSRPYRPGDWISIDGGTDGRVIEMNWRATHVLTAKRDLAIVPNSTIAKAKIVNASSPSGIHGMTVTVQLDAKTPPATSAEILQHAILNTQLILAAPAPLVVVKSITADATEFDISFFVEELAQSTRAQNELFDRISRHLAAAGIGLASTQSQPPWAPQAALSQSAKTAAERAVDLVAIFAGLTDGERKTLAAKTKHRHFDAGEALVEPGTVLHSLFVIGGGVVSMSQVMSEGEIELLRIGPGDHFGEIGLLTGHAAEATLRALVPITTYELAKEDLAPVLEARPEVSHELCRALARRQAAGQLIASTGIDKSVPPSRVAAWFSDRLHRLFDLANAE